MATKTMNFSSPKGVAQYAWLNTADTAFNQAPSYKVQLRLSPEEAKGFLDAMQQVANDNLGNKAKTATMPYAKDDETGEVILKFKSKYKPKFCDASGAVVRDEPMVGGGSTLKVKGNFYPYDNGSRAGVSLQMSAVQILDLVEAGGGPQFEADEGSYMAASNSNETGEAYDF